VTLLGLFGGPAVTWSTHSDSGPGELCPPYPPRCAPARTGAGPRHYKMCTGSEHHSLSGHVIGRFFSWKRCCEQGRNEVRWRPGQEATLAPPCANLRSFGSKSTALKKVLVTLLELFGASRSHSAPSWVVWHPHGDSAPGELCPLVPLVMSWLRVYSRAAVKLSSVERSPVTKGLKTAAFVYIFENFTVGIRNCLGDPQCSQLCSQLVKNGAYLLVPASYFLRFNDVRHFKLWWFLERSHNSTNKNSHLLASKRYPAILRDTQQFSQRRDIYKWKLFGAPIFDRPPPNA